MIQADLSKFGFRKPKYKNILGDEKMVYKKIEDKIFKFEIEGDEIEGELLSKEKGSNYDNEVYKIKDKNSVTWTCFSTKVLQSQMQSVKIGDFIKIVYAGNKKNPKKGQNDTKLFEVFIDSD